MRRFSFIAIFLLIAVSNIPVAPFALADQVGEVRTFFTDKDYDVSSATSVSATVRSVGQNAYFYVDDRYWNELAQAQRDQFEVKLNALAMQFDSNIYPKATSLWGSEPKPGVDNDPRITVLLEKMIRGSGGYFATRNEYPLSRVPDSNAREMIYLNAESILSDVGNLYLAHELQHLISFNQKELLQGIGDDVWLNEARSEYNITITGYDDPFNGSSLQRRANTFLQNSSDSLVAWPNTTVDYAMASIFSHYLADRFGAGILADTIHSKDAGVVAVNNALTSRGSERFPDVFTDWMMASYLNDSSLGVQYQYSRPGLSNIHVTPQRVAILNQATADVSANTVQEWQPNWFQYVIPSNVLADSLSVRVGGQGGSWTGALVGTYIDGHRKLINLDSSGVAVMPLSDNSARLASAVLAFTQGSLTPVDDREVQTLRADVVASLGDLPSLPQLAQAPSLAVESPLKDGDLIRRAGQNETYVIWGSYRRYLTPEILKLYGFENRPVISVTDDKFFSYSNSNYIRAIDQKKVYAVWPDGTKHWLNITAAQWDASGRDWNAIFTVNDAEVNAYSTGADITR